MKKTIFKVLAIIFIVAGIGLTGFGVYRYMTDSVAVKQNTVNEYNWDNSGDSQVGNSQVGGIVIDDGTNGAMKTTNGNDSTTEKGAN